MMKKYLAIIICVLNIFAQALETEITVLGVTMPGANIADANTKMQSLASFWPASVTGTSIGLANFGVTVPLIVDPNLATGPILTQLRNAKIAALIQPLPAPNNLRDVFHADVIIFFTGSSTDHCGIAEQINWTMAGAHQFIPTGGVDLNGSENSYAAIVTTSKAGCTTFPELAAHEFGHLFGTGHLDTPAVHGDYLETDSYAWLFNISSTVYRTLMVGPVSGTIQTGAYSVIIGQADNRGTLKTTAKSVANYRQSPGCSLTKPDDLVGSFVSICSPVPWTRHLIQWDDSCPSASILYEVHAQQPIGIGPLYPYSYRFSSILDISDLYVFGANANIKVKSCGPTLCTDRSSDTYFALSLCSF